MDATNGQVLPFHPSVEGDGGQVQSIVAAPDANSVVISGNFTSVNGSSDPGYGLARIDTATSASLALPINSEVRNAGAGSGITRLKSDGQRFYGVGWHYGRAGNVEGYFAANWSDGSLSLIQDCHGDTYDLEPDRQRRLQLRPCPLLRQQRRLPPDQPGHEPARHRVDERCSRH